MARDDHPVTSSNRAFSTARRAPPLAWGVREQNYIRRPLDLLRVHHDRIEAWMLEQAGIEQPSASEEPGALRVAHSR